MSHRVWTLQQDVRTVRVSREHDFGWTCKYGACTTLSSWQDKISWTLRPLCEKLSRPIQNMYVLDISFSVVTVLYARQDFFCQATSRVIFAISDCCSDRTPHAHHCRPSLPQQQYSTIDKGGSRFIIISIIIIMQRFSILVTLGVFCASTKVQLVAGKTDCMRSSTSDAKCPALVQGTVAGTYVTLY